MPKKNSFLTSTDQFCGAGGTATATVAAGIEVKMALNHWDLAIETHNTNHPETDHDCTDVQASDPRRYPSTDILTSSPECTNHSLAKGKKRNHQGQYKLFGGVPDPAAERSRATMWDVPRFAEYHDYNAIVVENVVDARKWIMWEPWLLAMQKLGYLHKCLYLNSMFFNPCPQSRDRLYVVFWKKGNKAPDLEYRPVAPCAKCGDKEAYQHFKPGRAYGKYNQQYVYRCSCCKNIVTPYYFCAFNVIDWTLPIVKIGDRKKALSPKTMERIQHGLDKYGGREMIVTNRYSSGVNCRVKDALGEPLPTQPGDSSHALLSCVNFMRDGYGGKVRPGSMVLNTQTTRQDANLLLTPPSIISLRGTGLSNDIVKGLTTVTAGGINHGLLVSNYSPGYTRTLDGPSGSCTTVTQQGILTLPAWQSFLAYYYGQRTDSGITDPINTMTTKDRAAIVQTAPKIEDCYYRCLKSNEVKKAMAFPDEYVVLGNSRQRVKQLGNAVTPPVYTWIMEQVKKTFL